MQDYSKLYRSKIQPGPRKKLDLVRRIIESRVSPSLMLAAITLIVGARK